MQVGKYGTEYSWYKTSDVAAYEQTGKREVLSAAQREEEENWEEKLRKWDEQIEQIKEENEREQERLQEEREERKRIYKKLIEKQAYKKYLARQDEISQLNEKISLERAVGEDVYIEKAPLSTSLSVTEILAICSEF